MAVLLAVSSSSCASNKKEYSTVKSDDKWYECSSFDVSDVFSSDEYEYVEYKTVGTTDDAVYMLAQGSRYFEYKNDMSGEEMLKNYDQSILKFSFDGELLEKTDYTSLVSKGCYNIIQKAWVSDGTINLLNEETTITDSGVTKRYLLNGEELILPDVNNYYNKPVYVDDIYTVSGYTILNLYVNSWKYNIIVVRPDGSTYEIDAELVFGNNYQIAGLGQFIPAADGKVLLPVFLDSFEMVFASIDPVSGEAKEIESLYGTINYWLEYASGKILARDYKGFNFVDGTKGDLIPICEYNDVDAPLGEVMESEILYASDDGKELILGYQTYATLGQRYDISGYHIMHLKQTDTNPHAGKTVLTLSTGEETFPSTADFMAIHEFNNKNGSYFVKYVFPYKETGEYTEVNADIIITDNAVPNSSDSNRFIDLAPYLELDNDHYFTNAINAAKTGDELYHMPLDISVIGILTASSNVPEGQTGFTFGQYVEFVDGICNGKDPLSSTYGYMMGKSTYFVKLFGNMSDMYIYDNKAHLDDDAFRELILYVDEYGSEVDRTMDEYLEEHNLAVQDTVNAIRNRNATIEGREGAVYGQFSSFSDYLDEYGYYGEGLGVYGLPSFDGRGPQAVSFEFVSIYSDTRYKDACIEFVKTLISTDIQKYSDYNPVNREALRMVCEEDLDSFNRIQQIQNGYGFTSAPEYSSELIDKYMSVLSSAHGTVKVGSEIEMILQEESSAYFNGNKALDDVIPVLQTRVQRVLDETK